MRCFRLGVRPREGKQQLNSALMLTQASAAPRKEANDERSTRKQPRQGGPTTRGRLHQSPRCAKPDDDRVRRVPTPRGARHVGPRSRKMGRNADRRADRKSAVEGTRGWERVDIGGRRIMKKKKKK